MSSGDNMNDNFFDSFASSNQQQDGNNELQQGGVAQQGSGENGVKLSDSQVDTTGQSLSNQEPMNEDADLFDIKQRVKGMDEEAARLIQLQNEMEQQMKSTSSPTASNFEHFRRKENKWQPNKEFKLN